MVKRSCKTPTICMSNSLKKIQFRIRFRRSSRFAPRRMLSLVIQSSQPKISLFITILKILQNMLMIYLLLNGVDLMKSAQRVPKLLCSVTVLLQAISSKELLVTAISLVLSFFNQLIQIYSKTCCIMMESSTVSLCSNSSKMVAGNTF